LEGVLSDRRNRLMNDERRQSGTTYETVVIKMNKLRMFPKFRANQSRTTGERVVADPPHGRRNGNGGQWNALSKRRGPEKLRSTTTQTAQSEPHGTAQKCTMEWIRLTEGAKVPREQDNPRKGHLRVAQVLSRVRM
jgi:hypothetical protein